MRVLALAAAAALAFAAAASPAQASRPEARALLEEGRRLQAQGAAELALERYEAAIAADPDYLAAVDRAIPLWVEGGHLEAAAARLERATLRHPRYARGWYALAYVYRRLGRDADAVHAYDAYLALRPGEAEPYFGLAMAHLALGEREPAAAALRRYLELEDAPERAAFRERARRELARLEPPPPRRSLFERARDLAVDALRLAGRVADLR